MIKSILESKFGTQTLDIHSGGDDLIFPHHENECAQSECLTGEPLAKYWMHNGMVMINGTKMSKSLNNYLTIKDALRDFKANTIRYFCLATHYKRQINFTHEALQAAENGFNKVTNTLQARIQELSAGGAKLEDKVNEETFKAGLDKDLISKFDAAMDEDLSSSQALALIFENISNENTHDTLIYLLSVLGFDFKSNSRCWSKTCYWCYGSSDVYFT